MGRMGTGGGGGRSYSAAPNDYKLLEEVGYGASATVYRAIYLPFNEVVAVKCLDLDRCNSNLVRRFLSFSSHLFPLLYRSTCMCVCAQLASLFKLNLLRLREAVSAVIGLRGLV